MNFGEANAVLNSKFKKSVIQYESCINEKRVYEFHKKSFKVLLNAQINEYWICVQWEKLKDAENPQESCCLIIICNNRIVKDPNIGHHTFCTGESQFQSNAQNLDREARQNCKRGLKRPLEAHTNMNSETVKHFLDPEQAEQVEQHLQDYKSMKSALRRLSRKWHILVEDVYDLPMGYQVTEKSQFANKSIPYFHEQWLLCSNPEQMVLAFMSDQDTSVISESGHLIMEGTFKVTADGFTQLYTIHAWEYNKPHKGLPQWTKLG